MPEEFLQVKVSLLWEQWWKIRQRHKEGFSTVPAQANLQRACTLFGDVCRPPSQSYLSIGRRNWMSNFRLQPPPTTSEHAQHVTLLLVTPGQRSETVQPWTKMEADHYCQLLPSPESMRWPSVGPEISGHMNHWEFASYFSISVGNEGKTSNPGGERIGSRKGTKVYRQHLTIEPLCRLGSLPNVFLQYN